MHTADQTAVTEYVTDMELSNFSPVTIKDRVEVLQRLARFLDGTPLTDAAPEQLRRWQATHSHLLPATVNIYARHARAFYQWAVTRNRVTTDPSTVIIVPKVRRGKPHPTRPDDLRIMLACTKGWLRLVYILAAFEGLRRGEMCRAQAQHLDYSSPATMLVYGKGGHERVIPLLPPVVDELQEHGNKRGWLITDNLGRPLNPARLSIVSHNHLAGLGLETTLHSLRHFFLTNAYRATRDPMFVRDLAGHQSVATTEIYVDSNMNRAHERLSDVSDTASAMLTARHLRSVPA